MCLQNSDSELATAQFSAVHNVVPSNNSLGHKDKFSTKISDNQIKILPNLLVNVPGQTINISVESGTIVE